MNVNELIEFERAKYGDEHINRIFELGFEFRKMKNKAMVLWDDDLTEVIEDLFSGELQTYKKNSATIEYNHKVKVPPKIDEYIKLCEVHGFCLKSALNFHMIKEKEYWGTARKWILENEKLFAEAWANGCEAEEEPKFYVVNSKGKYFCNMGFSIKHNFISNVIWQRDSKFEFKTKEAAEAVILLVGGKVEEHNV